MDAPPDPIVLSPASPWGWASIRRPDVDDKVHTVPTLDIRCHSFEVPCPCGSHFDEEDHHLVIHYAFDGREDYDDGRKHH